MITIKIGRYTYEITREDIFMDNNCVVQLTTQSKERSVWGSKPNPKLSKRVIKEISKFKRIKRKNTYSTPVKVFSLEV